MSNDSNSKMITIVVIGSYPDRIKGSLLRQFNIWYAFKNLKCLQVIYIPLTKHLVHGIHHVLLSDIVIFSGTCSSIYSLLILFIRKLLRKTSFVDYHGLGWFEEAMMYGSQDTRHSLKRALTFTYEFLSYKFADYVVVASLMLSHILKRYFGRHEGLYVIENSVTPIFEKVVHRLKAMDVSELRRHLFSAFGIPRDSSVLLCPLPANFISNKLASEALKRVVEHLDERTWVLVTGARSESQEPIEKIKYTGYISYAKYVTLMLVSNGVLLPYPSNAICGGVRNKVIEAGYCKKVVFSTRTGMLFTSARPWVHYYPIDDLLMEEGGKTTKTSFLAVESKCDHMAEEFKRYVDAMHSYTRFRHDLLKLLLETLRSQSCITRSCKR